VRLPLPDCAVDYLPCFLSVTQADKYLQILLNQANWRCDTITLFGKSHPQPRLSAWYGDAGCNYRYSGLTLQAQPWLPVLTELRTLLAHELKLDFNSVLLNYYRNGRDSMGWHSDDETELGPEPVIASLSLGAPRRFRLQHKRSKQSYGLDLEHGSLLLMAGKTQHCWRHQVPKTQTPVGPRVNLTFRWVIGLGVKT